MEVRINTRIQDHKGRKYTIMAQGYHTELKEFQVIYRDDNGATWISPLSKFSAVFKDDDNKWIPWFSTIRE